LNGECSSLEQTVNSHNQTLSVYNELETAGFGLKILKLLRNTIGEVRTSLPFSLLKRRMAM
jgi:hypothetical protein